MNSDHDYIEIKIVSGEILLKPKGYIIGYCHFPGHKGGITRKILKDHECLEKKCTFLEKYEDNSFWTELEKSMRAKQRRKDYVRQRKSEKEAIKNQWNAISSIYYKIVLSIIDEYGYDLTVLDIKKVRNMRKYVLIYISNNSYNDWYQYRDIACEFGKKTGCLLELKHAKNIDGSYATF